MAIVGMNQADIGEEQGGAFEGSYTLAGAGDTDFILIPSGVHIIAVTAQASGGATATVYVSTDPVSVIRTGTPTWVAWPAGAVTTATIGSFDCCSAIKMTQANAGASKMTVRCQ